jgi:zinc protease
MLFKGTPDHPDVPKVLKDHGADYNGTTWLDRTNYYETLPASSENLEFALRLEADRLLNSNVKAEDLATEMTVVRNEFEQGENSPGQILFQRMMATADGITTETRRSATGPILELRADRKPAPVLQEVLPAG